jgi:hypothetical protein
MLIAFAALFSVLNYFAIRYFEAEAKRAAEELEGASSGRRMLILISHAGYDPGSDAWRRRNRIASIAMYVFAAPVVVFALMPWEN